MFFVPDIFARKGPLSVVWLAAHFEKKLSKNQIKNTNITAIIEIIMNSNIKISLRTTSDLMIGLFRISNFQCKYLLDSSQHLLSANAFMANYLKMGKKKKRKQIDLPDKSDYIIKNLNIPEIFEFIDLNLPDYTHVSPMNRRSITIEEIPPLTSEEIKQEKEIEQRIYGLDNMDDDNFFDDILPPARPLTPQPLPLSPQQQLSPPEPLTLSPSEPIPLSPPLQQNIDLSPISGQPSRNIIDIPLSKDQSGSKRKAASPMESVEKRRKQLSESTGLFGNIQLEDLDNTSNKTRTPTRRTRRPNRRVGTRRARPIIDQFIKLSDNYLKRNLRSANIDMKVPDIFIPSKKLISTSIDELLRPLPKLLAYLFENSYKNKEMNEDFDPLLELSINHPIDYNNNEIDPNDFTKKDDLKKSNEEIQPPPTTTIEPVDEFFDTSLPPPLSPNLPGEVPPADDFDELDSLPEVRNNLDLGSDNRLPFQTIPELTATDRSIFAEQLNNSLNNLFGVNDILTFDQLSIPDNKKMTAAIYFYNLLQMANNGIINLSQEESIKNFNPIYITMNRRSSSESI